MRPAICLFGAVLLGLLSALPAQANEPFKCPPNTKASDYQPGHIVRWCEVNRDGRVLYHGPLLRWHRSGALASREFYDYGKGTGNWEAWHENGKPSSKGRMEKGSRTGKWTFWHEEGWRKTEVVYGPARNNWVEFFSNGKRHYTGDVLRSQKIGKWIEWNPDGSERRRCDFGEGLFKLESEACKGIADSLVPKGFSRPVPKVSVAAQALTLQVASEKFGFVVPAGWRVEVEAVRRDGLAFALIREGGQWRDNAPQMWARILYREGRSFEKNADIAFTDIERNVDKFKGEPAVRFKTERGLDVARQQLAYNTSYGTDSPFAIVTDQVQHESVAIIDLSSNISLMLVLTSPTQAARDALRKEMDGIVQSVERVVAPPKP
jgi:hypothetical protein